MHVRTHAHKVLLPPYYGGSSTLHPVKLVYQSPLHSTFFSTSLVGQGPPVRCMPLLYKNIASLNRPLFRGH